jgi:hypothetical protein
MYIDETSGSGSGDWAVDPEQVQAFAEAVADVRRQLDTIKGEVDDLSTPNFAPMLGTSSVGQELAEKFSDRMGSERGLRGQLNLAVTHMENFVLAAEHSANTYLQTDSDNAVTYKYG